MEAAQAIDALAALAQSSRLAIYRLLMQAGPRGRAAGLIAEKLHLPPATLSFHLAHLVRAGLVRGRQEGRFVIYSADFDNMNALVAYLTGTAARARDALRPAAGRRPRIARQPVVAWLPKPRCTQPPLKRKNP